MNHCLYNSHVWDFVDFCSYILQGLLRNLMRSQDGSFPECTPQDYIYLVLCIDLRDGES